MKINKLKEKIYFIKKKLNKLKINIQIFKKIYLLENKNINKKIYNNWIIEINIFKKILFDFVQIQALYKLIIDFKEKNNELFNELFISLENIFYKINNIYKKSLFFKKLDKLNCYIEIHYGAGGKESKNWTKILSKMYINWALKNKFNLNIIYENKDNYLDTKNITLQIKGKYAYGFLRYETGIHRLIRFSPYKKSKTRHTSFSSVYVYPIIINKNKNKYLLNIKDLKIDTFKSSGAGGQHVNTTNSAVRITHLPTGIITQNQNNRSQFENKKEAIKQLKSKLHNMYEIKKNENYNNMYKIKKSISWSNQIRSYIFDKCYIIDNRTKYTYKNIDKILSGNLNIFLLKYLKLRLINFINKYYE